MKKIVGLLSIVVLMLFSCDGNEFEINLGSEKLPEDLPSFTVDFDNQTFVADYVQASIVDGVTILKAQKNSTGEIIVIVLYADIEGTYTLSPGSNLAQLAYKKEQEDVFLNSGSAYSGRIDLTTIDSVNQKMFGAFSFIGIRLIPSLDTDGQPILDTNGNPTYNEEPKEFANGVFSNINYSTTEVVNYSEITDGEFFMKVDGEEFLETTVSAKKVIVDGTTVIQIRATKDGTNHVFVMQFPANVTSNSNHVLGTTTSNPATESIATYKIISLTENYGAYSGGNIEPILRITSHNINAKKIEGTFEFSAKQLLEPGTKDLAEGNFVLVYTDE